jgi:2-polyprenyl-6-methoxyphenol hydroxylase-like FAD-dependent oxidoreductase
MNTIHPERSCNVLVVGAGPVGLTLAAELARHGVRPRIIDRLVTPSPYCRAIGVSSRTLEVWDDMGVARDMIDAGIWLDVSRHIIRGQVQDRVVDLSDLPYAMLGVPQNEAERLLALHVERFGIKIERGVALESLTQSAGAVQAVLAGESGGRAEAEFRYVVGCDGAHSAVRRSLGIAFEGDSIPLAERPSWRCVRFPTRHPSCSSRFHCRNSGDTASRCWHRQILGRPRKAPITESNPSNLRPELPISRPLPTSCCRKKPS